ncbi:hypothetical protein, partial [Paraprevotella clara]|uniref:hypothetical protein n=1 Tax=Paraprevotella clara TaxID=454154 RepID=UPI003080F6B0
VNSFIVIKQIIENKYIYFAPTNKNSQKGVKLPIELACGCTKSSSLTYCEHQSCRNGGERKRGETTQAEG